MVSNVAMIVCCFVSKISNCGRYCGTDSASVRAELLPIMTAVGRDDVSCWVQWAVLQSQGFGFGFLGQSSLSTSNDPEHYGPNAAQNNCHAFSSVEACTKQQLDYVREKLMIVDKKLHKKFDDDRKYKPGDREKVLLVNAVLAKVCAQLALRKETGNHIKKMEELNKLITANSDRPVAVAAANQQQPNSANDRTGSASAKPSLRTTVYDPALSALVLRFRLDFEEWDISEDMVSLHFRPY